MLDACVIIASPAELDTDCARYISTLRIQHHGYMTHLLLGEVIKAACTKIPERHVREQLYAYLDNLLIEKRIGILPIQRIPAESVSEFRDSLPFLAEDDAIHLAEMRQHGISEFVTIDRELTNHINRQRLAQKGIRIIDPRNL